MQRGENQPMQGWQDAVEEWNEAGPRIYKCREKPVVSIQALLLTRRNQRRMPRNRKSSKAVDLAPQSRDVLMAIATRRRGWGLSLFNVFERTIDQPRGRRSGSIALRAAQGKRSIAIRVLQPLLCPTSLFVSSALFLTRLCA